MDQNIKDRLQHAIQSVLRKRCLYPINLELKNALNEEIASSISQVLDKGKEYDTREVNILLSDLRGFTSIAEKYPPVTIVELLNRYYHRMSEIILSHGGTIDKFIGDCIMVLFGAPSKKEDDIDRCLSCAIEMQIAMDEINQVNRTLDLPDLYMGIGINSGQVVAGNLGSDLHSEYTVIGDEVNLASRVEAHSLRGQILLSENTYLKARDFIEVANANEVLVKGKSAPVKMYELIKVLRPKVLTAPKRDIRKSPRIQVELPLAYCKLQGKSVVPNEHHGMIVDISYGGIFAHTEEELDPHSEIKINMALSIMGHEYTDIYAKVLRCNKQEKIFETHMEFTGIDQQAQMALKNFVDQQMEAIHFRHL